MTDIADCNTLGSPKINNDKKIVMNTLSDTIDDQRQTCLLQQLEEQKITRSQNCQTEEQRNHISVQKSWQNGDVRAVELDRMAEESVRRAEELDKRTEDSAKRADKLDRRAEESV